jgi:predicted class III extradiol MEMO1 family dioxygenase
VEIVSILVPYMKWDRLVKLSKELARVMATIVSKNNWVLGGDIAFLASCDCVHYGDEGWGKTYYCPFGSSRSGYEKAVEQEHDLIDKHLVGNLDAEKVYGLFTRLVDQDDVKTYKITWCGRFSVPFGLVFLDQLMKDLKHEPLVGKFLRYGTSVSLGKLPIEQFGMGQTAPSNLHHWVGYVAIGYR